MFLTESAVTLPPPRKREAEKSAPYCIQSPSSATARLLQAATIATVAHRVPSLLKIIVFILPTFLIGPPWQCMAAIGVPTEKGARKARARQSCAHGSVLWVCSPDGVTTIAWKAGA
jgi:hypothetical protein